ncbi:MAG: hypothetical protein R3F56_03955 [Planctomycetota bacterium]
MGPRSFPGLAAAAVRVDGCNRERLERLCSYTLPPPIAHERSSLTPAGEVLYAFK